MGVVCTICLLINDLGGQNASKTCSQFSLYWQSPTCAIHMCPWVQHVCLQHHLAPVVTHLPQEALGKLQVLQPLLVHSVHFCVFGCQNSFLQKKKRVGKSLRKPETTGPKEGALGAPLKTCSSELLSFGGERGILMHRHTHGHTVIFLLKQKQVQQEPGEEAEEEPGGHFCLPL